MNYIWVLIEKFSLVILKLSITIILARVLLPTDFGIFAMTAIIVSFSTVLVDSGIVGALIRKKNVDVKDYSTAFVLNVTIALILYFLCFLLAPYISIFYNENNLESVIKFTSLVLIFRSLSLVHSAILNRQERFKEQAHVYIGSAIVSGLVAILAASQGMGYWALVLQVNVEAIVILIFLYSKTKFKPSLKINYNSLKYLTGFGVSLTLASLLQTIYENIPSVVIGKVNSKTDLGYFTQANKLSFMYVSLSRSIVDKASYPKLSKLAELSAGDNTFENRAESIVRFFSLLVFFASTFLILSSSEVITIVLGSKWIESSSYLCILAISSIWMILESIFRTVLKSKGLAKEILKLEVIKRGIGIPILIVLAFISVKVMLYGYVALAILSCLLNIYSLRYQYLSLVKISLLDFLKLSILSLLCLFLSDVLIINNDQEVIVTLLLKFSLCAMIYSLYYVYNRNIYNKNIKQLML